MPGSTPKGVPYSLGTDTADTIDQTMQALAEWMDARPGVSALTAVQRDALAAADKWDGRIIWNTTDARLQRYNAGTATWLGVVAADSDKLGGMSAPLYLLTTDANAAYEAKVSRTGATTGQVPVLQANGTLAFATAGVSTEWLTAAALAIQAGTPALGAVAGWRGWLLDAAAQEVLAASIVIPPGWATVHIDVLWTNAGAGAGDVVLLCDNGQVTDAGALAITNGLATTATAPASGTAKVTRLQTGLAVTPGRFMAVHPWRNGAAAGDTLGNDILLIGLLVTKAS